MPQRYYTWSIFWSNPYSSPPAGMPRVLISNVIAPRDRRWSSRHRPPCIDLIIDQLDRGWAIGCDWVELKPPRKQSAAGKQSRRRKLLMNRLMKKYPLLAEQMYKDAIAAKPDYYGFERSPI